MFPLYILEFRDRTGLDQPEFYTLRLGSTWHLRLNPRDRVLIAYKDQAIGLAVVKEVDGGRLCEILPEYAHLSHMEHGLNDPAGAVQRRLDGLRKIYGPQRVRDKSYVTVLRLRRLKR